MKLKDRIYISEDEATELIKNITIASYYVPYKRFDFFAVTEALLFLANFINTKGTENFKIVYALYKVINYLK